MLPAMPSGHDFAVARPLSRRNVVFAPVASGLGLMASGLVMTELLSGCTDQPQAPPVDTDRVALMQAREREQLLLDQVRSWTPSRREPHSTVERVVEGHIVALDDVLDEVLGASPTGAGSDVAKLTTLTLAHAADRAADQHTRALRSAGAEPARLLASIAASDAAVAAHLRGLL